MALWLFWKRIYDVRFVSSCCWEIIMKCLIVFWSLFSFFDHYFLFISLYFWKLLLDPHDCSIHFIDILFPMWLSWSRMYCWLHCRIELILTNENRRFFCRVYINLEILFLHETIWFVLFEFIRWCLWMKILWIIRSWLRCRAKILSLWIDCWAHCQWLINNCLMTRRLIILEYF